MLGKVGDLSFCDPNVARVMDKAYEVGNIKIFSALAANAVRMFDVNTRHESFDTTLVNVCGDYDLHDNGEHLSHPFKITYGLSSAQLAVRLQYL